MKSITRTVIVPAAMIVAFGGGMIAEQARADQPYMHAALDELAQARATLYAGTPDKGGHRVRAIALIDRAMGEVKAGIAFAR